jgi:carboxynorspermidine decarboxylase
VTNSTTLETTVLDTWDNGKNLGTLDSSIEAHMADLLVYRYSGRIEPNQGPHEWMVCGKSRLAGDIVGEFRFEQPLQVGDRLSIKDAAAYTMVKKNWFNGVRMPAIAVRELDGQVRLVRDFGYADFASALS